MPITYERDDQRQLITVTVTEPYSVDHILSAIVRQAAENTWEYAMLYDLRAVTRASTEAELWKIADQVKVVGRGRQRGPVGMAIGGPALLRVGLMYTKLTRELMDVEALLTAQQLDGWLARNTRNRSSGQP